jgi:hypothetical protein
LLFAPDLHGTIIILGNRFDEAQKTKIRNCKKLGEYFVIPKDTTKPSKRAEFLEIVKIQSSDFIGRESNDSALSLLQRSHAQDRRIPSDGIRTYKRLQDACMDRKDVPDLIAITSFNEFHENTHIEPSDSHGKQYIEATRLFSERIKFAGGKDPRRRGFTVEVKSAQLKKQS